MANGDPMDVLRSLRRYVSEALGSPPWTVRIQRTRVEDDARPTAVVEESSPVSMPFARAGGVNQGDVQNLQAFTVVAYPTLGDTAAASKLEADKWTTLLKRAFSRGLVHENDDVPPVLTNIGMPFRVPIYDFEGVPIEGPDRAGPAEPYQYLSVDRTMGARSMQDPLDELRFTCVVSLRGTWWEGGRTGPDAPTVRRMPGGWLAPPALPAPVLGGGVAGDHDHDADDP